MTNVFTEASASEAYFNLRGKCQERVTPRGALESVNINQIH